MVNGPSEEFWSHVKEYLRAPHEDEEQLIRLQQFLSSNPFEMDLGDMAKFLNSLKAQYEEKWPKTKRGGNRTKRRSQKYHTLSCSQCGKKRFVSSNVVDEWKEREWNCTMNKEDILFAHCGAAQESTSEKHPAFVNFFAAEFDTSALKIAKWLTLENKKESKYCCYSYHLFM